MKYILLFFITWTSFGLRFAKVDPYTETGYKQFSTIVLDEGKRLLNRYGSNEIDAELRKVKRKFFGNNTVYFIYHKKGKYVSNVIFSRSNRTKEQYSFSYNLESVKYSEISYNVKGNIDVDKVFKQKSGNLGVKSGFSITYGKKEYSELTETNKMTITVYPGKKITLQVVGDVVVSNGVSKDFFFGFSLKKGAFEVVEVLTTVYELVEEDA